MIQKTTRGWQAIVEVGVGGARKRKQRTFRSKKDAQIWEKEMEYKREIMSCEVRRIKFCELLDLYLDYKRSSDISTSTMLNYESQAKVVATMEIYDMYCDVIKLSKIETEFVGLSKNYSHATVESLKGFISAIFTFGVDNDYALKNPAARAKVPKHCKAGREIDSFTKEEVQIIENNFRNYGFGDVVYFMLNTGLRTQELCALEKTDVFRDGDNYFVNVDKAMSKNGSGWEKSDTKTKSSVRQIPITEKVFRVAREISLRNNSRYLVNLNNKVIEMSYQSFLICYKEFFNELQKDYPEVRYLPPHCCRHTYASRCHWSGIDAQVAKKLLGHTKECMTMHYTHIQDDEKINAVKHII